ncbi:MAG: hypothetical protein HY303_03750 [Candidatus Wallbacteria bacterium]|nr:hypothetical protein [Candidatus Wallbacteria bacterium]
MESAGSWLRWGVGLAVLAALLAAAASRFVEPVPDREQMMSVLLEAGVTGRAVREVRETRGIGALGWARGVHREASDPGFERELASRLTRALEATTAKAGRSSGGSPARKVDR